MYFNVIDIYKSYRHRFLSRCVSDSYSAKFRPLSLLQGYKILRP